jgi:phospholipid/cholesterol/gamma-HCH transport system permease protein
MSVTVSMQRWLAQFVRGIHLAFREWLQLLQLGASLLVLTLTPANYNPSNRAQMARHLYVNTAPILLGFSIVCALVTVVLTRIVLVTAHSYGLTQYAVQVVIRVLILELIPLTAALFVALRNTIPDGAELLAMHANGEFDTTAAVDTAAMQKEVLPRVVAGLFSGATLAALSSVVVLIMAYLTSYGFTVSGLASFTRLFGQVFSPAVSLIFALKTLLFCLTVSLIPMASALYTIRGDRAVRVTTVRTSAEMRGLVRMFAVILLIEMASLVGNYY